MIVESQVPAPAMRLLGPTQVTCPPFSLLIDVAVLLSTLVWRPTMAPAPLACTEKAPLERSEVFVIDAMLEAAAFTPPVCGAAA